MISISEDKMNLYQKLAKIRKGTEVIQRDRSGYGYKYVGIDEILSHVTAGMNKYNVSLIPNFVDGTTVEPYTYTKIKTLKNGERYEEPITEFLANSNMVYTWINNDNPSETISVPWYISGSQSDPSQAMGSAMTYGLRYFLMNFFQIAAPEDDPDSWRSKQKEAENAEEKSIAKKIIDDFDAKVKLFLADHPDKSEEVKKFVMRYVKNGNYLSISEPVLASKLLEEFTEKYINTNEKENK